MRREQRRASARDWIRTGAHVSVSAYAKRYGVDRFTAHDDLTAIGVVLPASEQTWASRPPSITQRRADRPVDITEDSDWTVLDGRRFFIAGYTPAGLPFGVFEDEVSWPQR